MYLVFTRPFFSVAACSAGCGRSQIALLRHSASSFRSLFAVDTGISIMLWYAAAVGAVLAFVLVAAAGCDSCQRDDNVGGGSGSGRSGAADYGRRSRVKKARRQHRWSSSSSSNATRDLSNQWAERTQTKWSSNRRAVAGSKQLAAALLRSTASAPPTIGQRPERAAILAQSPLCRPGRRWVSQSTALFQPAPSPQLHHPSQQQLPLPPLLPGASHPRHTSKCSSAAQKSVRATAASNSVRKTETRSLDVVAKASPHGVPLPQQPPVTRPSLQRVHSLSFRPDCRPADLSAAGQQAAIPMPPSKHHLLELQAPVAATAVARTAGDSMALASASRARVVRFATTTAVVDASYSGEHTSSL